MIVLIETRNTRYLLNVNTLQVMRLPKGDGAAMDAWYDEATGMHSGRWTNLTEVPKRPVVGESWQFHYDVRGPVITSTVTEIVGEWPVTIEELAVEIIDRLATWCYDIDCGAVKVENIGTLTKELRDRVEASDLTPLSGLLEYSGVIRDLLPKLAPTLDESVRFIPLMGQLLTPNPKRALPLPIQRDEGFAEADPDDKIAQLRAKLTGDQIAYN